MEIPFGFLVIVRDLLPIGCEEMQPPLCFPVEDRPWLHRYHFPFGPFGSMVSGRSLGEMPRKESCHDNDRCSPNFRSQVLNPLELIVLTLVTVLSKQENVFEEEKRGDSDNPRGHYKGSHRSL